MKPRHPHRPHPPVPVSSPPLRRSALGLAAAGLFALPAAPALAATIPVDSGCTLVNAIVNANADMDLDGYGGCIAGLGADTIPLPIGTETLTAVNNITYGPTGLPVITSDITIQGATGGTSSIVRDSTAPPFGILAVAEGGALSLQDVVISGGAISSISGTLTGGIVNFGALMVNDSIITGNVGLGGAVVNFGTADLSDSAVSGNSAFIGGGVVNGGSMSISNSLVSGNLSLSYGGGLLNLGSMSVSNSTVSGNTAKYGGGIANAAQGQEVCGADYDAPCVGSLNLVNTTVSGNSGLLTGGGVLGFYLETIAGPMQFGKALSGRMLSGKALSGITAVPENGSISISNSTISGNSAGAGGGIALYDIDLSLSNSTVSNNAALYFDASSTLRGGGMLLGGGVTVIANSTVTSNSAASGQGAGIFFQSGGNAVIFVNTSIIAGNSSTDVDRNSVNSFISEGDNLIGDGNSAADFDAPGDQTGVAPGLGVLANNGGPTQTHALLSGSPAINAVFNNTCPPPATDQRGPGFPRPLGARCDIGAFEAAAPTSLGFCDGRAVTIRGTILNDVLMGTPGPDVIDGREANDTIDGKGGNDVICGGPGNDTMRGGDGNDRIIGDHGVDKLFGDKGNDTLKGGGGKDALDGGAGNDNCDGGAEKDTAKNCEVKDDIP